MKMLNSYTRKYGPELGYILFYEQKHVAITIRHHPERADAVRKEYYRFKKRLMDLFKFKK
jgi:hypothetical protein